MDDSKTRYEVVGRTSLHFQSRGARHEQSREFLAHKQMSLRNSFNGVASSDTEFSTLAQKAQAADEE